MTLLGLALLGFQVPVAHFDGRLLREHSPWSFDLSAFPMTTTRGFLAIGSLLAAALTVAAASYFLWPELFRWLAVSVLLVYTLWESGRCLRLLTTGDDDFFGEIESSESTKAVEPTGSATIRR